MGDYFWLQEAIKHPEGPLRAVFAVVGLVCVGLLLFVGLEAIIRRVTRRRK